jgi:hypothetical protein
MRSNWRIDFSEFPRHVALIIFEFPQSVAFTHFAFPPFVHLFFFHFPLIDLITWSLRALFPPTQG